MNKMPSLSFSAGLLIQRLFVCLVLTQPDRLLTPIGAHRTQHITPSKGKRRKRKRHEGETDVPFPEPPPALDLTAYVDVGLAAISRHLQQSAASPTNGTDQAAREAASNLEATKPYSVVFVARSGQSSAFNCHFPQMVAVASRSSHLRHPIRLVGFSKACEDRLSAALGIPRVSSIALREEAPNANGLVDYVREHVPPIEIAWVEQAESAQYHQTKIDAVPTKIGVAKQRKFRDSNSAS
ncbi:hypothetical protein OQA88_431 [Cercophora sp. LCS_1]